MILPLNSAISAEAKGSLFQFSYILNTCIQENPSKICFGSIMSAVIVCSIALKRQAIVIIFFAKKITGVHSYTEIFKFYTRSDKSFIYTTRTFINRIDTIRSCLLYTSDAADDLLCV